MIYIAILGLVLTTTIVFYKKLLVWWSKSRAQFKARLSKAIFQLMVDVWDDWFRHLETICESDGDEPFEPYMDSPLRTCTPQTEYILSPPKEEISADDRTNNNERINTSNRGRARRRVAVQLPRRLPQQHVPVPVINQNQPLENMLIIERLEEIEQLRARAQNLLAAARVQIEELG